MDLKKFKRITVGKFCYEDFFKECLDSYVLKRNVKYIILKHEGIEDCDRVVFEGGTFTVDKNLNLVQDLYVSCCHYHCIIWYSGCYSNHSFFKQVGKYEQYYLEALNMTSEEQKRIGACFLHVTESTYSRCHWGSVLDMVETNWDFDDIDFDRVSQLCSGKANNDAMRADVVKTEMNLE